MKETPDEISSEIEEVRYIKKRLLDFRKSEHISQFSTLEKDLLEWKKDIFIYGPKFDETIITKSQQLLPFILTALYSMNYIQLAHLDSFNIRINIFFRFFV